MILSWMPWWGYIGILWCLVVFPMGIYRVLGPSFLYASGISVGRLEATESNDYRYR